MMQQHPNRPIYYGYRFCSVCISNEDSDHYSGFFSRFPSDIDALADPYEKKTEIGNKERKRSYLQCRVLCNETSDIDLYYKWCK